MLIKQTWWLIGTVILLNGGTWQNRFVALVIMCPHGGTSFEWEPQHSIWWLGEGRSILRYINFVNQNNSLNLHGLPYGPTHLKSVFRRKHIPASGVNKAIQRLPKCLQDLTWFPTVSLKLWTRYCGPPHDLVQPVTQARWGSEWMEVLCGVSVFQRWTKR